MSDDEPERHSGAWDSTTVDWSGWMTMTPQQQADLWARYRRIIRYEVEDNVTAYRNALAAMYRRDRK